MSESSLCCFTIFFTPRSIFICPSVPEDEKCIQWRKRRKKYYKSIPEWMSSSKLNVQSSAVLTCPTQRPCPSCFLCLCVWKLADGVVTDKKTTLARLLSVNQFNRALCFIEICTSVLKEGGISPSQNVAWLAGGSASCQTGLDDVTSTHLAAGFDLHRGSIMYRTHDRVTDELVAIKGVSSQTHVSLPCESAGFLNLTCWRLWSAGKTDERVSDRTQGSSHPSQWIYICLCSLSCLLWSSCWRLELRPLSVKHTNASMLDFSVQRV